VAIRPKLRVYGVVIAMTFLAAGFLAAQTAPEITAKPVPGQLDVMQGTAIKLGGSPPASGPQPESFHWEIAQGKGGVIYDEDQFEAIFQAPKIDTEMELFVIRLTVNYPGDQPAHATMHIRVHRDMPQAEPKAREMSIEEVMTNYYREEQEARDRNKERVRRQQPQVISHHTYRGFHGYGWGGPGWGWGYGWGWPAYYPVYAPIVIPPPGIDYGPGDGHWDEPIAIPYDDVVTTFPEHVANDYLPQDFPGAEPVPDMESAGGSPTDFIQYPSGALSDDPGPPPDPGFEAEMDIFEPMIDPGFGADDFDW
jgi:hypothetical protein